MDGDGESDLDKAGADAFVLVTSKLHTNSIHKKRI